MHGHTYTDTHAHIHAHTCISDLTLTLSIHQGCDHVVPGSGTETGSAIYGRSHSQQPGDTTDPLLPPCGHFPDDTSQ